MRKSVLFLIDSLNCGGAEKSLISLLPLLDYSKITVDLMMVNRGGVFEEYIPKQVKIVDFPNTKGLWPEIYLLGFRIMLRLFPNRHSAEIRWRAMSSAYRALDKIYDVAIAYQQGFPTYYLIEKVKSAHKFAWINTDLEKAGYRVSFNRPYYDKMDRVVPVSERLYEMLKQTHYVKDSKLYTVLDILNVDLIKKMSHEIVQVKMDSKELVIVTVGRMVAIKGYDLAVEAAKILKRKGLSFMWLFVGDGGMRLEIEQMISNYGLEKYIVLVGMTPNPYPYMAMADIYVQTSKFEGFGLTLNEARILNKPVISTNFPVVYNQIRDGENGLIGEMTADSIAEKVMLLASNVQLREKLIESTKLEVNTTSITEPQKVMNLILS
jgi:glycosyltransferase involved in cell wall biosynthesis